MVVELLLAGCAGAGPGGDTAKFDDTAGADEQDSPVNLEDGKAGYPEGTAAWAASLAVPVARAWKSDAILLFVSNRYSDPPDLTAAGTSDLWDAAFISPSAPSYQLEVRVTPAGADGGTERDDCEACNDRGGFTDWRLNSDDLVDIATSEAGRSGWGGIFIEGAVDYTKDAGVEFDQGAVGDDEPIAALSDQGDFWLGSARDGRTFLSY